MRYLPRRSTRRTQRRVPAGRSGPVLPGPTGAICISSTSLQGKTRRNNPSVEAHHWRGRRKRLAARADPASVERPARPCGADASRARWTGRSCSAGADQPTFTPSLRSTSACPGSRFPAATHMTRTCLRSGSVTDRHQGAVVIARARHRTAVVQAQLRLAAIARSL